MKLQQPDNVLLLVAYKLYSFVIQNLFKAMFEAIIDKT